MSARLGRVDQSGDMPCRCCKPGCQAVIDQETRDAPEQRKEEACRGLAWDKFFRHFEAQFLLFREWLQGVRVLRLEAPVWSGCSRDHQTSPLSPLFSSSALPIPSEDIPSIFINTLAILFDCPGCVSF